MTLILKLAAIDFMYNPITNYGSIRNRFHARNYFRFRRVTMGRLQPVFAKTLFTATPEVEILQLATVDFLFDFNTMYGSIGHRFNDRNYFRHGETGSTII